MNLKEFAKENNITLAEAKSITGLTHWAQKVPEIKDNVCATEVANRFPDAPPADMSILKEAPVDRALDILDSVSYEAKRRSVNGLGTKSPYWKELRG